MATSFFGNSEEETESRVFAWLDQTQGISRLSQSELEGRVRHLITDQVIRPDGLLVFGHDTGLRCLAGRVFALEVKPDVVVCDHLKMISELSEQARSYVDSRYDHPAVPGGHVDGCIVYPNLETILARMQPDPSGSTNYRNDDYKRGILDMHRRVLSRQRIYELEFFEGGFGILCCDEWLIRFWGQGQFQVTGKNHQFRRKVGSDYR